MTPALITSGQIGALYAARGWSGAVSGGPPSGLRRRGGRRRAGPVPRRPRRLPCVRSADGRPQRPPMRRLTWPIAYLPDYGGQHADPVRPAGQNLRKDRLYTGNQSRVMSVCL